MKIIVHNGENYFLGQIHVLCFLWNWQLSAKSCVVANNFAWFFLTECKCFLRRITSSILDILHKTHLSMQQIWNLFKKRKRSLSKLIFYFIADLFISLWAIFNLSYCYYVQYLLLHYRNYILNKSLSIHNTQL